LSLDGGIRGIRGALPIAIEARGRKISRLVVPEVNAREAAMVSGVDVYPVRSLIEVIQFINSGNGIAPVKVDRETLLNCLRSGCFRGTPGRTSENCVSLFTKLGTRCRVPSEGLSCS
jgi:hypothetical protein